MFRHASPRRIASAAVFVGLLNNKKRADVLLQAAAMHSQLYTSTLKEECDGVKKIYEVASQ